MSFWRRSVLVVLLAGVACSCDLFSTRSPDPPGNGTTFLWTPATSITTLLADFQGALQAADAANYAKSMIVGTDSLETGGTATYQFIPRSGIDKTLFTGWTVQSEQGYLTKMLTVLPKSPKLTLLLTNESINQANATNGSVTADYSLLLPVDASSGVPQNVVGSLQFQVALVTTEQATKEWRIVSWTDIASSQSGTLSWTDLKSKLSS